MKVDPFVLTEACGRAGKALALPGVIGRVLLEAIAEVESSYGANAVPKYEPAYDRGGRYFSPTLAKGWGAWAACSYGPFQVMFPVFLEMGLHVTPITASDPDFGAEAAARLINRRFASQVPADASAEKTVKIIGDAYNSGTSRDKNVPVSYCDKLWAAYQRRAVRYAP